MNTKDQQTNKIKPVTVILHYFESRSRAVEIDFIESAVCGL